MSEACAVADDRDPRVAATPSDVDQPLRLLARFTDDEHRARVAVVAVHFGRHVDVDDVADFKPFALARDPVTDHVIAARAYRRRKALVPELTRTAAVPCGVLPNETIDVGR
jgi:hypothetical protein